MLVQVVLLVQAAVLDPSGCCSWPRTRSSPPYPMQHEPHQRVASPVGDSIPEPRPEARSEPPGECPAPWATMLPTSLPVCWCWPPGLWRCWVWSAVCGLRAGPCSWPPSPAAWWQAGPLGLLVRADDVVLVLMRPPPGCGVVMLPDAGPRAARAPWVGLAMGQR